MRSYFWNIVNLQYDLFTPGASRPSIMERGEAGGIAHVSAPPANLTQSLNPSLLRKPPPEFFHSILNCMPLKRPHLSQLLLSDEDTDNIGLNEPVFGCDEDTGWALSDGGSNKRQNTGQMTSAFTETPLIEGWKPLVKPVVTTATLLQVFGKMEPIGANVVRSTVLPQLGDGKERTIMLLPSQLITERLHLYLSLFVTTTLAETCC